MELENKSVETLYTKLVDPSISWIEKNNVKSILKECIEKDPVSHFDFPKRNSV